HVAVASLAGDDQPVRPRDDVGGNALRQAGGVCSGDDVAVGVDQLQGGVEVRAELRDVDGEIHRAVERVEGEGVQVAGGREDRKTAGVRAGNLERIGGGDAVAVIVGAIAEAVGRARDDGHVI